MSEKASATFCVNCKFLLPSLECAHPDLTHEFIDPVFGTTLRASAYTHRIGKCGPEAKLFSPILPAEAA